jgi:hypothetical protein
VKVKSGERVRLILGKVVSSVTFSKPVFVSDASKH